MTPAERAAKIDAIKQEVLSAGHDANDVVKKMADKLTQPQVEQSTIIPLPKRK